MEYERRIVCFMDLLGFKKMISDSTYDSNIRNRIFDFLSDINEIQKKPDLPMIALLSSYQKRIPVSNIN